MAAHETASVNKNFEPFVKFISDLVDNSLKGQPDEK
jgi:hypothetical protein